ncbi:DUF4185 domain-containing protein [Sciscionella sediminilitoris]|uniref:DUF4185 domain-containing protein n=1 Tax=Sciscionella sediminilitoris TaxID=1445613 RepID=UPI0005629CCB|nr:DUF4185 domain-containing protein [Sciscionella sp. SE31]
MTARGLAVFAAAGLIATLCAAVPAQAAGTGDCTRPSFGTGTANTELTGQFSRYGEQASGRNWSGGDSTYSVRLPDGRIVWLFSDTFLGPVRGDGTRAPDSPFIHNSFVTQRGTELSTVYGKGPDAVLHPPDADPETDWYWVGAASVTGDTLTVLYLQWHLPKGSQDPLGDLEFRGNLYARYSLGDLHLIDTHPLPSALPLVERGSWLLTEGGYTYLYGVRDHGAEKNMELARVRGTDLSGKWEFRTADGWSDKEADSAPLLGGVANEYSVSKLGDAYVLVTQDTTKQWNNEIVAYTSCAPDGPFTGKTVLYRTPEGAPGSVYTGPNGHTSDKVYSYNAHVHPELSGSGRLTLSYNVNTLDTTKPAQANDNYADTSIYRPRFVDVPVTEGRKH